MKVHETYKLGRCGGPGSVLGGPGGVRGGPGGVLDGVRGGGPGGTDGGPGDSPGGTGGGPGINGGLPDGGPGSPGGDLVNTESPCKVFARNNRPIHGVPRSLRQGIRQGLHPSGT